MKGHRLTLDLPMDEDEQPTGETGEGLCECGAGWNGGIDGIRASHYAHIDQED